MKVGEKTLLRFSTAGSVDDGKSTLIGRLLLDGDYVPQDTLKGVTSQDQSIDLANLTDGLRSEREQKITIDVAYRFFSTKKRHFILADTPGHEQYTRNMATGASTSNLGLILIDASKGVLTQTKRHSFILSLLGIKHLVIAINKMDLVEFDETVFETIKNDYLEFIERLQIPSVEFIPVSALQGDNVVKRSDLMPWYTGETLLSKLENCHIHGDLNLVDARFIVQTVIRPDGNFRGFGGRLLSGILRTGDAVRVLPGFQKSRIGEIFNYTDKKEQAYHPESVTITLEDEIDIGRGTLIVPEKNLPHASQELDAMIVWFDSSPLEIGLSYVIKHLASYKRGYIEEVSYTVDINTLSRQKTDKTVMNDVARVKIALTEELFFDEYAKNRQTGSFILIHPTNNRTLAAGMILDKGISLTDSPANDFQTAKLRNISREQGEIRGQDRSRLLGQIPHTIWLTGLSGAGKSTIAKKLESLLYHQGRASYILDGDNVRFGLCKDLDFSHQGRTENIRRVAEVARLMNDAGLIVICAFISPAKEQRNQAKTIIGAQQFVEVFVSTSLADCEKRDVKGLYARARNGEIPNFTGIGSPYEAPDSPSLDIDTAGITPDTAAGKILDYIEIKFQTKP